MPDEKKVAVPAFGTQSHPESCDCPGHRVADMLENADWVPYDSLKPDERKTVDRLVTVRHLRTRFTSCGALLIAQQPLLIRLLWGAYGENGLLFQLRNNLSYV